MTSAKLSPESVNYRSRDTSGVGWLRHCGDCVMLQLSVMPYQPSHCTLVEDPSPSGIDPEYVCDEWEAL